MKQYLLSVHYVEGAQPPPPDQVQNMYRDVEALNQKLRDSGSWVFACGLHEPSSSTVVQIRDGEVLMTDGPFAEAKEHLGGFWIVKVPDLDAALEWARQATIACQGPVEVRPLQDESES